MKQWWCQHIGMGRKILCFSILKTELKSTLQKITTVENDPLFLFPCNFRTIKMFLFEY